MKKATDFLMVDVEFKNMFKGAKLLRIDCLPVADINKDPREGIWIVRVHADKQQFGYLHFMTADKLEDLKARVIGKVAERTGDWDRKASAKYELMKANADTGEEYMVDSFDSFEKARETASCFKPSVQSEMFIQETGNYEVVWAGTKAKQEVVQ